MRKEASSAAQEFIVVKPNTNVCDVFVMSGGTCITDNLIDGGSKSDKGSHQGRQHSSTQRTRAAHSDLELLRHVLRDGDVLGRSFLRAHTRQSTLHVCVHTTITK